MGSTASIAQVIVLPPIPVIKAPSTTTITSSANPSFTGQPVLLKATVTSSASTIIPTGSVHFFNSSTNVDLTLGGVPLVKGVATFTTPDLASSTSYTATYSGDNVFVASTGAVFEQIVNNPPIFIPPTEIPFYTTTTTLASNVNPSVAGSQPVTFTATVSSDGGAQITGKVEFWDNTNNINLTPGGVVTTNRAAKFTTSSLPFGDLNITAIYRGDANGNQQSTSNSVIQRVQLNFTGISIVLASDLSKGTNTTANTTNWGDQVTFIATVSTGVGAPSGTVVFSDNGFLLGTANMDGSGKASFTTNLLDPGTHTITASYFSFSNSIQHSVIPILKDYPTLILGISNITFLRLINTEGYNALNPDKSIYFMPFSSATPYGKAITCAAYVQGHESTTPTGNVVFNLSRNGRISYLGVAGLNAKGVAYFTSSNLPISIDNRDSIIATYVGNDLYKSSNNEANIWIGESPTSASISSDLNPAVAGQKITFTAAVATPFPESNALPPDGGVIFSIDGINQPPVQLNSSLSALLDISSLSVGKHYIKANYLGNDNYKSSSTETIIQVVEQVGSGFFNYLGDSQSTLVNTAFPNPIQFNIVNLNPKLVAGATVTFTTPSSGPSGTFSNGTNSITVKTTANGSLGVANSGIFNANGIAGTYTITATVQGMGINTFTMTNIEPPAPPVAVTIGTSVQGILFSLDGFNYTTTQTFNLEQGKSYSITTTSPQIVGAGIEYTFTGWSDGNNDLSRAITAPVSPVSYIATFTCEKQWVLNKDGDNYYTGEPITACQSPEGYVLKGNLLPGDCDDNNPDINPATLWYLDADKDGYANNLYIPSPEGSCLPPQDGRNYIYNPKGSDCADNDATNNPETVWVMDADGDGYYVGDPYTGCFFIFQPGYVRKTNQQSGDCDDANSEVKGRITWYLDADKDGYASSTTTSCTSPGENYFSNILPLGDCDDNNAAINPATIWYEDNDNDGYPSGSIKTGCERPKFYYGGIFSLTFTYGKLASELAGLTLDCDDRNASVNSGTVWYKDFDNDGFSDGTSQQACYQPSGYKRQGTVAPGGDCNDADAAIHPNTKWYPDLDNDGFSNGNYMVQCARPEGYKLPRELMATTGDCNDNNATLNPNTAWYKDADNDGYTDFTMQRSCFRPTGYKLMSELTSSFEPDCNDASAIISPATKWYKDADDDGYSDGISKKQCTQPDGYKLAGNLTSTGGDCDDNNPVLNPATVWYKDADDDGYSSGDVLSQCNRPPFYKLESELSASFGDCNDLNPSVNPGAVEICRNGIDDNCNGLTDEAVCVPCRNATALVTTNITAGSATFKWSAIANPDGWHIQYKTINKGSKWVDVYVTGNKRSVTINTLLSNQNYLWQIQAKCGKGWTDYTNTVAFKTTGNASAVESRVSPIDESQVFEVITAPNPSDSYFTLTVKSSNTTDRILVRVVDELGRVVEQKENVMTNTTIRFGDTYIPGIYFIMIQQGKNSKAVKLIRR